MLKTATCRSVALFGLALSGILAASPAHACGTDPFIGEVCTFATPYCPTGFLPADGRTMAINNYAALYSLLGNRFGGDGKVTFNLPNLPPSPTNSPDAQKLLSCIAVMGIYPLRP